jgi:hypothetical protein
MQHKIQHGRLKNFEGISEFTYSEIAGIAEKAPALTSAMVMVRSKGSVFASLVAYIASVLSLGTLGIVLLKSHSMLCFQLPIPVSQLYLYFVFCIMLASAFKPHVSIFSSPISAANNIFLSVLWFPVISNSGAFPRAIPSEFGIRFSGKSLAASRARLFAWSPRLSSFPASFVVGNSHALLRAVKAFATTDSFKSFVADGTSHCERDQSFHACIATQSFVAAY